MISKELSLRLNQRGFISVATSDLAGQPNAVPKFILKEQGGIVYLVDYTIGKTWENLKVNPRVSLSLMDMDTLRGYKLNGTVELLDSGALYDELLNEMQEKTTRLTVDRVVEGIQRRIKHRDFEAAIPQQCVVYKVIIGEIVAIGPQGQLIRE